MIVEDDNNVICGPEPYEPIPEGSLGKFLFENLLSSPDTNDAMVDAYTGETISYKTILEETCNLAEALRRYGNGSGSIHAICSENNVHYFVPVFASLYIGATVVPINHAYTRAELNHSLELTAPSIVFCSPSVKDKFLEYQGNFIKKIIIINSKMSFPGTETLKQFVSNQMQGFPVLPYRFQPFNDCDQSQQVAFIMSSSGTTGLPKGVMISHRPILVRIAQSRDPRTVNRSLGNTVLGLMPFYHGYGLNLGITSIVNREKLVVLKRFEPESYLKAIQDYRIENLMVAPPLAVFMAKTPLLSKYDLSSVKSVLCGAAPLNKEIEDILKKRLNITSCTQGYGLTEINLAVTLVNPNEIGNPGTVGKVVSYMKLKVRDPETGRSLGPHQVGEICVKGPMLMKGYYKNEEATRHIFTSDGWLKTGDLGYYDTDRFFYIVDRLKELIKYKGYQVAPAELEALLINHPKVLDVGVVGLPDILAGELPLAFIVKKPGENLTEKELQDFVANSLSPQKWLRGGVIFVSEIPKNPSGKILRRELRKRLGDYQIKQKSKL
ncbi:luciferin 4-monooxygenase [Leptinotarsa decemlineata]|uniref:luciferin 4-monooxygenase n=1 Tax=Leptinotarsa decemlineata TaxID=7539 RepID=UPI003D3086B0